MRESRAKRGSLKDIEADGKLLTTLKDEDLPDTLQAMKPEERQAYVDKQIAQRKVINEDIAKVSKEREEYIRTELEKKGNADAFDAQVTKTIQTNAQAARAAAATRQSK